jgi:DNA polymerase-3 subunit delta'
MGSLIGHEKIRKIFERLFISERLSHACLIVGPDMVGKNTAIKYLASRLVGVDTEVLKNHPDVVWVERDVDVKTGAKKAQISVEQIRSLRERLYMSSLSGGYKIAIISDADAMNQSASNALLKILEEAPKKTVIFLRSSNIRNLPKTIVSRTQVFYLSLVSKKEIESLLVERGASQKEADELSAMSHGRPGVALKLLSNRAYYKQCKDDAEFFIKAGKQTVVDRLKFAKVLSFGGQFADEELADRVFQSWEIAARENLLNAVDLLDSCGQKNAVAVLEKISQSRESLKSYTPLQMAFEHTLLHL